MEGTFAESEKLYEVADYFCVLSGNDLTACLPLSC